MASKRFSLILENLPLFLSEMCKAVHFPFTTCTKVIPPAYVTIEESKKKKKTTKKKTKQNKKQNKK